MKNSILSSIISLLIFFLFGELVTRIYFILKPKEKPTAPYDYRELNEEQGWITKASYYYKGSMTDLDGKVREIEISTNENGFRSFGDVKATDKKKVFFVGDSYTHAVEVSNEKTFYNILSDSFHFECFAYGSAGYGTLQEYLILKKYLPVIDPDIVVLQLCSNDFIDNHPSLEVVSNYSVGKRRPYLKGNDEIYFETPKTRIEESKKYSTLFFFVWSKLHAINRKFISKKEIKPGEQLITEQGNDYSLFTESQYITELILKKINSIIPSESKLIVFVSDHYEPQHGAFKTKCETNNIRFVDSVAAKVKLVEDRGAVVRSLDGYHWNEVGHRIAAKSISKDLDALLQNN